MNVLVNGERKTLSLYNPKTQLNEASDLVEGPFEGRAGLEHDYIPIMTVENYEWWAEILDEWEKVYMAEYSEKFQELSEDDKQDYYESTRDYSDLDTQASVKHIWLMEHGIE